MRNTEGSICWKDLRTNGNLILQEPCFKKDSLEHGLRGHWDANVYLYRIIDKVELAGSNYFDVIGFMLVRIPAQL